VIEVMKIAKNSYSIGLAKEAESPENPGGLEKRVALIPRDIQDLIKSGFDVYVETGAGEGIGFSDTEYQKAGAFLQTSKEIYRNKQMVIKFKGPPIEKVHEMDPGTILFCMAHFHSFPERAKLLEKRQINVIAMEEILASPKSIPDEIIKSKCFVNEKLLAQTESYEDLHIGFLGYEDSLIGGVRRAGNRNPKSLCIYQSNIQIDELSHLGTKSLYFYDSKFFEDESLITYLKESKCQVFDLQEYLNEKTASRIVNDYRDSHPPFKFGGRRIQCLHETGMAGARYGLRLLREHSSKKITEGKNVNVSVLGYGNVGMGAINECYQRGVRQIQILGRSHTKEGSIENYLNNSNLIINGAEQAKELRGKNYLIKKKYIGDVISTGSVVIDLVGGSSSNRSPVEDVIDCTYLTNPHFEREGVLFSALWGWPMLGMMKESAVRYSGQILDILIEQQGFKDGLNGLEPGVQRALVCGPFNRV
jgi:alanine dehydrogenase